MVPKNFLFITIVLAVCLYSLAILCLHLYVNTELKPTSLCNSLDYMDSNLNDGIGCPKYITLDAVVIVISASYNFDRRGAIRETWGNIEHYTQRGYRVRIFFFIAMVKDKNEENEKKLSDERSLFKDILIVDTEEEYKNIIQKHVFALNFLRRECMNTELVVKTDDDVYVDIVGLIRTKSLNTENQQSILCSVNYNAPVRNPGSKWYVDPKVFGGSYPPYCFGSFYSMNISSIEKISSIANCRPYFWLEDVFMTGVMRVEADIPIKNLGPLAIIPVGRIDEERVKKLATPEKFLLVYHDGLDAKSMHLLYEVYNEGLEKQKS